jgi:hypothetical protein
MTAHTPLPCDTFDEWLPDYLEGTLGAESMTDAIAHVAGCLRCAALVRDLEGIRREAQLLPELAPSRDLWTGIAARIDTPVVPLAAAPSARPTGVLIPRAWIGAIAAGLIAATAGATYMATIHLVGRQAPTTVARTMAAANARGSTEPITTDTTTHAVGTTANESARDQRAAQSPESTPRASAPSDPRASAADASPAALASRPGSATATYDREIESLRAIVRERTGDLDPRTVAILESNLRLIDQAIAESRAAVVRDPASRFLRDQLNRTLDQKLELLRTAALLRSRT